METQEQEGKPGKRPGQEENSGGKAGRTAGARQSARKTNGVFGGAWEAIEFVKKVGKKTKG